MRVAKQYSPETITDAKRFTERKGKHLAQLLLEKKRTDFWDESDEELLDDEIKNLKIRIKNAKLITFGF